MATTCLMKPNLRFHCGRLKRVNRKRGKFSPPKQLKPSRDETSDLDELQLGIGFIY